MARRGTIFDTQPLCAQRHSPVQSSTQHAHPTTSPAMYMMPFAAPTALHLDPRRHITCKRSNSRTRSCRCPRSALLGFPRSSSGLLLAPVDCVSWLDQPTCSGRTEERRNRSQSVRARARWKVTPKACRLSKKAWVSFELASNTGQPQIARDAVYLLTWLARSPPGTFA